MEFKDITQPSRVTEGMIQRASFPTRGTLNFQPSRGELDLKVHRQPEWGTDPLGFDDGKYRKPSFK